MGDGPITLTERAAERIVKMRATTGTPDAKLRVAVSGGGCSGFQYGFEFDENVEDGDVLIERDDATVVVDPISLMYLAGSEIDYVEELIGAYFTINNPNATASCSCGNSFAVG